MFLQNRRHTSQEQRIFCAIVSLLRSSDSFLNGGAKQAQQAKQGIPGQPNGHSAKPAAMGSEMSAQRLLQGLRQIRQKPVAQSAKIVL